MATARYMAIIERGAGTYGVFFPDLPGCVSAGNTVPEACEHAEEALAFHLAGMIEDGDELPPARSPEDIERDPDVDEVARMMVRAELPGKSIRVNISMDEGLLAAIDLAARSRQTTRSGLLADAARRYLAR